VVGVALDGVDLPRLVTGTGDPDLVLNGVTARGEEDGGGGAIQRLRLVKALEIEDLFFT